MDTRSLVLLSCGTVAGAVAAMAALSLVSGSKPSRQIQAEDESLVSPEVTCSLAHEPLPRTPRNGVVEVASPVPDESKLPKRMRDGFEVHEFPDANKTQLPSDRKLYTLGTQSVFEHIKSAKQQGTIVVGVAGGTGSGKTTLAKAIRESLKCNIAYISHDNYYKDLSNLTMKEREDHNFDHPDSLDTDIMFEDVLKLKRGLNVEIPLYDFTTHTRLKKTEQVLSEKIILVEGILIFTHPRLRDLIDVKIFVDTADDVRLIRRLRRDLTERGRSTESVIKQYMKTVRPMHLAHVEPSKLHADVIVPVGLNQAVLDMIIARLRFAAGA